MKSINLKKTGENIRKYRLLSGKSVRDVQNFLYFSNPGAIYKWQDGICLPTLDNLVNLADLFNVDINDLIALEDVKW